MNVVVKNVTVHDSVLINYFLGDFDYKSVIHGRSCWCGVSVGVRF